MKKFLLNLTTIEISHRIASIDAINFFDKRDIFSCTYSCTSLIFIGAPTWQSESLRVLV